VSATNPTPDFRNVKRDAVELVKYRVYAGDFDRPLPKPDPEGFYNYKDDKIHLRVSISPRDGWLSCSVVVYVRRRRGLFRKSELVMSTGFGYDVQVFRPGLWCDYLARVAAETRTALQQEPRQSEAEAMARIIDENFAPIDDSSIFQDQPKGSRKS
jgi:hypothetical protein